MSGGEPGRRRIAAGALVQVGAVERRRRGRGRGPRPRRARGRDARRRRISPSRMVAARTGARSLALGGMTVPEVAFKLEGISPRAYQHPADRAATAALHEVPYLDEVVRQARRPRLRARAARGVARFLGPPRPAPASAGVGAAPPGLPRARPRARARALPDRSSRSPTRPRSAPRGRSSSCNSELIRLLDDDGRRAVLAHEAAHVHSGHVLYQTALLILLRLGSSARLPLLAGLPLLAIQLALLEWFRAAELSCDRAAALRHARPAGGLPLAHGHLRRRGGRRPEPRRLHRPGHGVRGGRPGDSSASPG